MMSTARGIEGAKAAGSFRKPLNGKNATPSDQSLGEKQHLSFKALPSYDQCRRKLQKANPRTCLYITMALIEVIMCIMGWGQIAGIKSFLWWDYQQSIEDHLGAMHFTYTYQTDFIATSSAARAKDAPTIALLRDNSTYATAQLLIKIVQTGTFAEYATAVTANYTIAAGSNNFRVGQYFNPGGVLTLMSRNLASGQVVKTVQIDYSEYAAENPPIWRDRVTYLDAALKYAHPVDVHSSVLMRFVVTPVYGNGLVGNLSDVLGYLIYGHMVNGKAAIASRVTRALGDYAGFYLQDSNNSYNKRRGGNWLAVSHDISYYVQELANGLTTLEYDPMLPDRQDKLAGALLHRGSAIIDQQASGSLMYGVQSIPQITYPVDDHVVAQPNGCMVRGVSRTDPDPIASATVAVLAFLGATLLLDLFTLFLALFLFLEPLERLGKLVKKGGTIDFKYIQRLNRRRHAIWFVSGLTLVAVGFAITLAVRLQTLVHQALTVRSSSEPGFLTLAYTYRLDQARAALQSLASHPTVIALAGDKTHANLTAATLGLIKLRQDIIQLEIWSIMDALTGQILVEGNTASRQGVVWDPANLVTDVRGGALLLTRTGLLSYAEAQAAVLPYYAKKLSPTTPTSSLLWNNTRASNLVRWSAVPGFKTGSTTPQLVIVEGDVGSGQSLVVERANNMVQRGYSAIYVYTEAEGFRLSSSVLRGENNEFKVDATIEDNDVLEQVRDSGYMSEKTFTGITNIRGDKYYVSARCYPENTRTDALGLSYDYQWAGYPTNQCFAILVNGLPYGCVKGRVASAMAWQWVGVCVQAGKALAMMALCYIAYKPFHKVILSKQMGRRINPEVGSGSGSGKHLAAATSGSGPVSTSSADLESMHKMNKSGH